MVTRSITLELLEDEAGLFDLKLSSEGFDGDATAIALVLNVALAELSAKE